MLRLLHQLRYWVALLALPASAQPFTLDGSTIAGGGGLSTGGGFALSGTLGQADAGQLTNGTFTLAGGFWSVVLVEQPLAPPLSVEQLGAVVRVWWPRAVPGWRFESASHLLAAPLATPWIAVPAAQYRTNATQIYIDISPPRGIQFYRLGPASP